MLIRVSLISGQDGGTASKSGVCSPAVVVPHQPFYPNSGVNSPARYMPIPGLPYKTVSAEVGAQFSVLVLLL